MRHHKFSSPVPSRSSSALSLQPPSQPRLLRIGLLSKSPVWPRTLLESYLAIHSPKAAAPSPCPRNIPVITTPKGKRWEIYFSLSTHLTIISKPPASLYVIRYYKQRPILPNPFLEDIQCGSGREVTIVAVLGIWRSFREIITRAKPINFEYFI
jgi:hypothetical protein